LKKWWKRRLPEFYKMLLGDVETVVVRHSGLSHDEVRRSQRLLVAEISVFDFQRTKEGESQRASPITNRPGNSVRDVVQKNRQAKRSRTRALTTGGIL
jgi:hypothetical protein